MNADKIVLVTGGNRGIGLEMVRQLASRGCKVFLAARKRDAAEAAKGELGDGRDAVQVVELDVTDDRSIEAAAQTIQSETGSLDVLINNAGVYPDEANESILSVGRSRLEQCFQTNTFGPVKVAQAMLPLLRKSAGPRIVNVSSGYGQLEGLSAGVPSYCLSKLTLNGVTIMLHQALNPEGVAVNSMCPGWVRTDMGGPNAPRSVDQGADTGVWLACEAPQSLSGKFFRDRAEIPWQ